MADEIATWYEVKFNPVVSGEESSSDETGINLVQSQTEIGSGTALNFSGVEAGEQSIIKCVRIKFSRRIAKLRFWVVNNITSTNNNGSGGVFDDGWGHGYHIRGCTAESPLLNANDPSSFVSTYYQNTPESGDTKVPYGLKGIDASTEDVLNSNYFVYIPRDTNFFTIHPNYYQWGQDNLDGNFGTLNTNADPNDDSFYTPYIYLVVNPPLSADGGARTGWGYRISFLYS